MKVFAHICCDRYFPVPIKGHVSHDVLPLCLSCHYKSNRTEVPLREQIAVQFNAPIVSSIDTTHFINFKCCFCLAY